MRLLGDAGAVRIATRTKLSAGRAINEAFVGQINNIPFAPAAYFIVRCTVPGRSTGAINVPLEGKHYRGVLLIL